ncbi:uncharacterized protein LOC135348427 isoform X3 [Halichondria panicea]|uniref:uncharacterized protein LOC135348427 isoform X3 n=1 Tax=Halichondria panicea TaxID=6063 RepID=UPI00312B92B3
MDYDTNVAEFIYNDTDWCYDYNSCIFEYRPCEMDSVHDDLRYTAPSASWVLTASILVFFMKAGFMLLEVAFARDQKERRYVVVLKHQDAFASAFGFFLIGFDLISYYSTPQDIPTQFFGITDPVLWFFKFTFASNAATIVGGCLVTNPYKLRMPAAFVSAFVISGIIHPIVARIIWSDDCNTLSPYRFCDYGPYHPSTNKPDCGYNCTASLTSLGDRIYVLDFAGGGAVHLIGGMCGLMVCLFAKYQDWKDNKRLRPPRRGRDDSQQASQLMDPPAKGAEMAERVKEPGSFWTWMYPVHGGDEAISEAALGVFILWFCWFAFNCGSTESIEVGRKLKPGNDGWSTVYPFYGVTSIIAVNMIMAGASGGITAIVIAVWAQVRYRTESVNANEIANGVLSALVSITSGCAFVDYWAACLIGSIGVILYHVGCFIEYKTGIKDTARVVPVHGLCGLWSLIATGVFIYPGVSECNLHAAFEGLCYCTLRLPYLSWGERLLAQLLAGLIMIAIGGAGAFLMYFTLHIIPIAPFTYALDKVFRLTPDLIDGKKPLPLKFVGGWLLTSPEEDMSQQVEDYSPGIDPEPPSMHTGIQNTGRIRKNTTRSNMGTTLYGTVGSVDSNPMRTPVATATYTSATNGSRPAVRYKGQRSARQDPMYEGSDDSNPIL